MPAKMLLCGSMTPTRTRNRLCKCLARTDAEVQLNRFHANRIVVPAIVLVGFVLRLGAIIAFGPGRTHLYEFGQIGYNLNHGRGYSYFAGIPTTPVAISHLGHPLPSAFMPPGYTYVVATAQAITSSDVSAIRIIQILNLIAGSAVIVMVYLLGRTLFGEQSGRWSALIAALYPVLIYQATQSSSSNVYLPIDLLVLWLLVIASRNQSPRLAATAGACLGVLCLFRSEAVLLIPLFTIWLGWKTWRSRRDFPHIVRDVGVIALAFVFPALVVSGAWLVRNTVALGEPSISITTSGGFNFWIGNHSGANGDKQTSSTTMVGANLRRALDSLPASRNYEDSRDRLYLNAALQYVRDHPWHTALTDLKKLGMTAAFAPDDPRTHNVVYLASWAVLAILGIWGACLRPGTSEERALLYIFAIYALVVIVVFVALPRYKLSVEIILMLFAGCAVAAAERHFVARSGGTSFSRASM
jgi:4-amino-4-deoxy-L-arabinose transferase-like glycosyltransferase